jgi:hypothetical protein
LKVFITPITTFENTLDWQKVVAQTSLQILNQVELVEVASVEHVEEVINRLITKGQSNLGLWANISRTKCRFQRGVMLPKFGNV